MTLHLTIHSLTDLGPQVGNSCSNVYKQLVLIPYLDFEIWQTVPINGINTPLKGVAIIDMLPSTRGSGRGAEGNAIVVSKLNIDGH